jgi:hypothetical protein
MKGRTPRALTPRWRWRNLLLVAIGVAVVAGAPGTAVRAQSSRDRLVFEM